MTQKAYRRSDLIFPLTPGQVASINDEFDAIYRELKKLRTTADGAVTTHNLLSTVHTDTTPATETDGDIIVGQSGKFARLAKGNPNDVLQMAGGTVAWNVLPSHNLLSSTHGDTTAAAVAKGAIIAGSATKWEKIAIGTDGQILTADSTQTNGLKWSAAPLGAIVVASVYRSSNKTLTSGAETAIDFDTEHFDASNMWVVGSPTKLTCPTSEGGTYHIDAQITLGTGFAGTAHLRIYKNGTLIATNSEAGSDLSSGSEAHQVGCLIDLVPTDYVELKVLLELIAGGTFALTGGTNALKFQASKCSPQASGTGAGDIRSDGTVAFAADESMGNHKLTTVADPAADQDATNRRWVKKNAWAFLEEQTASASGNLSFASTITSDYDEYDLELVGLVPATNAVNLILRFSTDGGSTYDSGANYGWGVYLFDFNFAGVGSIGGNSGQTEIRIVHSVANTSNYSVNGHVRIYNPGSTSLYKSVLVDVTIRSSDGNIYRQQFFGLYLSTTAVNALRIQFSSGNITSGKARTYGLGKG